MVRIHHARTLSATPPVTARLGLASTAVGRAAITIEPVDARTQLRRFADVPYVLHHDDPRWRPPVRAWDQWRLDARRHPYFDRGDAAYFLARQAGQPIGRIAAHISHRDAEVGAFGFFDAPDDIDVAAALLDASRRWLDEQGVSAMTGPVSWSGDDEFGVLVEGHDLPAVTGLPWHPAWYGDLLVRAGLTPAEKRSTHRIATDPAAGEMPNASDDPPPGHAGRYADRHLVLDGIAAVPDVSGAIAGASLRSAWQVARQARTRSFDTAVCVCCDGDPAALVPLLAGAAAHAGYRWLLAPWSPDGAPPERTHRVFSTEW